MPSWLLLLIFLGSAAVIWVSGVKLSDTTDVLAERLHLGVGARADWCCWPSPPTCPRSRSPSAPHSRISSTSPSATSSAASRSRRWCSSRSTLFGRPAAQAARPTRRPVLVLVLEGALVVAVLRSSWPAPSSRPSLIARPAHPGVVLIAVVWVVGADADQAGRAAGCRGRTAATRRTPSPSRAAPPHQEGEARHQSGVSTRRARGSCSASRRLRRWSPE